MRWDTFSGAFGVAVLGMAILLGLAHVACAIDGRCPAAPSPAFDRW